MILLSDLNLSKQVTVEFQSCSQVIERLFEISVLEVGLAQLCIGRHENKEILLVDINQELTKGQLLNAHLNDTVGVL